MPWHRSVMMERGVTLSPQVVDLNICRKSLAPELQMARLYLPHTALTRLMLASAGQERLTSVPWQAVLLYS